eukprot:2313155-Amphidinium_carterae.1
MKNDFDEMGRNFIVFGPQMVLSTLKEECIRPQAFIALCPRLEDATWSDWSDWGACSATCGDANLLVNAWRAGHFKVLLQNGACGNFTT